MYINFLGKIQPKWKDNMYEYGLCTQIDSRDGVIAQRGVCPEPLKCEVKVDKHICTCGKDKFIDLDNSTKCGKKKRCLLNFVHSFLFFSFLLVYYIDTVANADDECPTKNAERNPSSKVCQCLDGYKPTADNRQCGLLFLFHIE